MWQMLWMCMMAVAAPLQFESHGGLGTWEGIVTNMTSEPAVRIIDTEEHDGHFAYVHATESVSRAAFFEGVTNPGERRWMPFMAYDLRDSPVAVDGRVYTWALQIRRYRYRDDDAHLAKTIDEVATLVREAMLPDAGRPLVLVYSEGSGLRPRVGGVEALEARGLTTLTVEQMLERVEAAKVSVLNPGDVTGRLVRAGERVSPGDIVVYEEVPEHVPPVAGIITLRPLTPLSHVNLLARNRGTVHVSARGADALPDLAAHLGEVVRLRANEQGVRLERSDEAVSLTRRRTPTPVAEREGPLLVRFSDPHSDTRAERIGGKASGYARLQGTQSALTRPGAAVSFQAYLDLMEASGAQQMVDELVDQRHRLTAAEVSARLAQIRACIEEWPLDPRVVQEIRQLLSTELAGVPKIRLRSSTNAEDLPQFNGAGLYESRGFRVHHSDDRLADKVRSVMASLWLDRAWQERAWFGIDQKAVAMAILINPAFEDETANGVVLAQRTPEGVLVQINAQPGEDSVAHARGVSESFLVREGVHVVESQVDGGVFLDADGQLARSALLAQLVAASHELLADLSEERLQTGDTRAYAVDIEFKIMGDALFLKQVRPLALHGRNHLGGHLVSGEGGGDLVAQGRSCFLPEGQRLAVSWVEGSQVHVVGGASCPAFTDVVATVDLHRVRLTTL